MYISHDRTRGPGRVEVTSLVSRQAALTAWRLGPYAALLAATRSTHTVL